jgi:hypothetical protein
MRKLQIKTVVLSLLAVAIIIPGVASASTNYAVSGLCVSASQNYGENFFDISGGLVYINGQTYQIATTVGLLASAGNTTSVYARENSNGSGAVISNIKGISDNNDYAKDGVLLAKVTANTSGKVVNIENHILGCSNYVALAPKASQTSQTVIAQEAQSQSISQMASMLEAAREILLSLLAFLKR